MSVRILKKPCDVTFRHGALAAVAIAGLFGLEMLSAGADLPAKARKLHGADADVFLDDSGPVDVPDEDAVDTEVDAPVRQGPPDATVPQDQRASNRLVTAIDATPADEPSTNAPAESPQPPEPVLVGQSQERALSAALVGSWTSRIGKRDVALRFTDDSQFCLDEDSGTYAVAGNSLTLQTASRKAVYQFALAAAVAPATTASLTLSGGDLSQPLTFAPERVMRSPGAYLRELFHISPQAARMKLHRILVVCAIVVLSRLLIAVLRALNHFVVFSEWGPLRLLYRRQKSRMLTLHSLVLNLIKYVVYFAALGMVLTELGVNYTTYIASLSVIGLAVGFGSQGLVQDIVTGFFVIFEGQFDVGDMVEISGQTGIVEELGLRMTKLRNYLGQAVVTPNRNIAVVGNYRKGAMQACVDTAVASPGAAEKAVPILRQLGLEIVRQFEEVIMSAPVVTGPLSLASGEHFVRMETTIWPMQQWVIEQQLVPRIREILKREAIEIPADRVVTFYHRPEPRPIPASRIGWTGKRQRRAAQESR